MGINKLTQVEDHYYKKEEYDALTPDQKKVLHQKHGNCGHKKGAKDSALPSNSKPKTKDPAKTMLSKNSIHAIATTVAEHHSGNDSTGRTPLMRNLTLRKHHIRRPKFPVIATIPPCNISEHDIFHWPPLALPPYVWHGTVLMHKYLIMVLEPNSTHADTTDVGTSMALVIHDYEQPICAHGYTGESLPDENCHIVSAVVADDHPETGDTFMLVFNQAVFIDKLPTNLVSPMQLCDVGIHVNDEPKSMALKPTNDHNAIVIPDGDDGMALRIPLRIQGVITYFHTHKPTK